VGIALVLLCSGGYPPGGWWLKVEWLQRDSEIGVAKFVQPLGLRVNSSFYWGYGLMGKAPVLAGAFLISIFSLPEWVELIGNADVACFYGVRWFGGLTRFSGGPAVDFSGVRACLRQSGSAYGAACFWHGLKARPSAPG
jgi:hypothetical protein